MITHCRPWIPGPPSGFGPTVRIFEPVGIRGFPESGQNHTKIEHVKETMRNVGKFLATSGIDNKCTVDHIGERKELLEGISSRLLQVIFDSFKVTTVKLT